MDKLKFNWFTKLILKLSPRLGFFHLAKKLRIENPLFEKAHELFSRVDRIDLLPLKSGHRGFIMVLNKKTALYFYQDGDRFVYDGFEMGEYEKGDITIFDNLRSL
ncbi:MAG: hypothetical protein AAB884_01745 [Patescibacteria group bacterium]